MTTANRSKIVYSALRHFLNDASTLAKTSLHGLSSALHGVKLTGSDKASGVFYFGDVLGHRGVSFSRAWLARVTTRAFPYFSPP